MKKITFLSLLTTCLCCWASFGQINPIEVTGFNEDVIANGIGPMAGSTTIPIDADNFCYLSEDWKLNAGDADITVGLPSDGIIVSPNVAGLTYQIPTASAPYQGNNSLRIGLSGASNAGTMTFVTPENYSDLYLLVTSGSGSATVDVTVNFLDGTSQIFTGMVVPDWYQTGLPVEASGIGRGDRTNNNVETPFGNPKLFQLHLAISPLNQIKEVQDIIFTKTDTGAGIFNLFAVSGSSAAECLPPFEIAVSNVTLNSAEVSWNSIPEITEWEIEFGVSGFVPGQGTVVSDNDGAIGEILNSLDPATTYDVYVKSICSGSLQSSYIGPISFNTLICDPIDQCNYTFKLFDDYGDGWNGNSMSILQNGINVATLQLTDGSFSEVQVPICEGVDLELYWNSGGSFAYEVNIEIVDPSGTTIYSKGYDQGTQDSSLFTTTASCPEPPLNDNLIDAIAIVLDQSCTGDIYSNVLSTNEPDEPLGSCFDPSTGVDNTVWFSFTAPASGAVNITTDIAPADFDTQIAVYAEPSDVNDLLTLSPALACDQDGATSENGTSSMEITGLTAGAIYYVQVDGKNSNQGNFCIEIAAIPCPDPSDIEINDIMGNSADIVWVSNGIETEWQIEYGPTGFEIGSGTIINDTDDVPGVTISDLSIDTGYEVYVSAICGAGETSNMVGPVAFTTPPCPENIEVFNDEGLCGAIVQFNAPESATGGTSENLLLNPSAADGLNNWTIDQDGGDGWLATADGFITSYATCSKSQEIILADAGFTDAQMDSAPEITISEDYIGAGSNFSDTYFLVVELRGADGSVIANFSTGNITTTSTMETITHTFSDYGPGVRSVYFQHGGDDAEFWGGHFGSLMTNAQVTVDLPAVTVVQTEGLPTGSEFPIGVTTNTFEITEGNEAPTTCSFNVAVLDIEAPQALVNDITIELEEDLTVDLTAENIDAGSMDNCGTVSMSLDIVSLNCENIGENEVILTVTDESGNSSVATSTVTLVDPNDYCDLSLNQEPVLEFAFYPNPTNGEFFVESKTSTIDEIEIYDLSGRKVKTINGGPNSIFLEGDISQFASGIYFLQISSGSQNVTKRIIKN